MGDQASTSRLGAELLTAVLGLNRRYRSRRPVGGLGDAALGVLIRLQKAGPQTLTELCSNAGVSLGSMSQAIRRLEELGYLDRTRDPDDARRVLMQATGHGAAVAAQARRSLADWFAPELASLTPEERTALEAAIPVMLKLARPRDVEENRRQEPH